jgi:hypothetical protein
MPVKSPWCSDPYSERVFIVLCTGGPRLASGIYRVNLVLLACCAGAIACMIVHFARPSCYTVSIDGAARPLAFTPLVTTGYVALG